jgi:hypothetical protein
MGTQLDLDDVAATSELAKKQLDELRAEKHKLLCRCEYWIEQLTIARVENNRLLEEYHRLAQEHRRYGVALEQISQLTMMFSSTRRIDDYGDIARKALGYKE